MPELLFNPRHDNHIIISLFFSVIRIVNDEHCKDSVRSNCYMVNERDNVTECYVILV